MTAVVVLLVPALMLSSVHPGTRIVQEVAREWREAGKLPTGVEVTGREDDRPFWAEVERRLGELEEAQQTKRKRERVRARDAEFEGKHPRARTGLFAPKSLEGNLKDLSRKTPQRKHPQMRVEVVDAGGGSAATDAVRRAIWAILDNVPLAVGRIEVRGQYPGIEEAAAVSGGGTEGPVTVWLNVDRLEDFGGAHEVITHELGHTYDRSTMPEWARQEFSRIMGETRAWRSPPNSPHERFAEAYSLIARGVPWSEARNQIGGYGFRPNKRQYQQLHGFFRALALSPATNAARR